MNATHERSKSIFLSAAEIASPDERRAYIEAQCGDDDSLRQEVDELLRHKQALGSFLEAPAVPNSPPRSGEGLPQDSPPQYSGEGLGEGTIDSRPIAERPGTVIGPYKLLQQIGEGGMGVVFMAEQTEPIQRTVALKIIKPGMDTRQVIARFEAERQALAMMDHPNIARVLDAGTTDVAGSLREPSPGVEPVHDASYGTRSVPTTLGRPFFVMDLVKGVPITEYCDQQHLSVRRRLELFTQVCHAVQHAHQKGIIHRDLKPSNVLVAEYDGKPVPKIIDFGVAKATAQRLTERTMFTQYGQIVGTFEYMSPEQARFNQLDVDTRSDIYSLGVLLYELLAGSTPLEKERLREAAFDEVLRIIREEEPPRPSTRLTTLAQQAASTVATQRGTDPARLSMLVRDELDWIVMKCLEKDRNRRYDTANSLAADIERYLNDEPVLACPPSARYRLGKLARKYRRALAVAAAFVLLLVTATVLSIGLAAWALQAESETRQALERETAARKRTRQTLARISDRIMEETFSRKVELTEEDKKFLREVLNDYEAFAAEAGDGAEARDLRAEGYARVGVLRHRLGELPDAEDAYLAALKIRSALAADFPTVPKYRLDVAASHNNLANLLNETGRTEDAEAAYRAAADVFSKLASDFPTVPENRKWLAATNTNLGLLLHQTGRVNDAEAAYRGAREVSMKLSEDFPTVPEHREVLAVSHHKLAGLLIETGRAEEAEAAYHAAEAVYSQLTAEFPAVPKYRLYLGAIYNDLGLLLRDTGRLEDAKAPHDAALEILSKLAADFPAVPDHRRVLAVSYNNLGVLRMMTGRTKDAESAFRAALKIQTTLAADFPSVRLYRRELAGSHDNLGLMLRKTSTTLEAEAAYRAGLEIRRELVDEFPSQPDHRNELTNSLIHLANLENTDNDFAAALRLLDEARVHHRAALDANPNNPTYREYWRNNRWALCTAQLGLKDHAEAAKAARELASIGFDPANDAYDAACYSTRCISVAQDDGKLPPDIRDALTQQYSDQAMTLLIQAVASGYADAAHMKKDEDLAPLRLRDDFKNLLARLESK